MTNTHIIEKFYTAFSEGNSSSMIACYHSEINFYDPVFGNLKGKRANKMWEMLLSKKNESTKISFDKVSTSNSKGSANWVATYNYGKKKRRVVNEVSAKFKFKDGLIIEHIDSFDLWNWTKQALGATGFILGWSSFMKKKIRAKTNAQLDKFIKLQN